MYYNYCWSMLTMPSFYVYLLYQQKPSERDTKPSVWETEQSVRVTSTRLYQEQPTERQTKASVWETKQSGESTSTKLYQQQPSERHTQPSVQETQQSGRATWEFEKGHRFKNWSGCCGRDRMIVGFKLPMQSVPIATNVVSSNPFMWGVPDTTLCDKVCQWLATGRWFSSPKVALSTIKPNLRIGHQFENLQKGHQSADVCDVEIKHGLEAGRRSESYIKYFNNIPDQSFVVFHLQRIDFKV